MTTNGQHNPPPRIRATLLGKVRISVGDRIIADDAWSLRSARALLLLLLITRGHAMASERVRDILWPEASPDVGRNALYKALHLLRRVLEPDLISARESTYIETRGGTIAIAAHVDVRVDAEAFEAALRNAMLATGDERRGKLRQAVGLYGGELLPTDRYEDWPIARRESLRYAWEGAVLDLAEMDLDAGEPQASVPTLELLLAVDPTVEAAHRILMAGYIAAGQRDRAIRQYARCVTALANELGIEPDAETQALYATIKDAASGDLVHTGRFDNLPAPPTSIVGRDREVDALQGTLWRQDVRLVTLIGPGGVGKTRLAIEAASQVTEDFADGVAFVPLAAVRDPGLLLQTIANTLGLREEPNVHIAEILTSHLRAREMLLVLDNVEQLLGAAPDIGNLLASCPALTVLVTSRERLQLRGEVLHEVAPLSVPRPDRLPPPALLTRYGSVALFIQNMQRIDPDFDVTPENSEVVSAICRHLEGLPLAIELATARARFFTLSSLLARLARRLDIEAGPRDLPARQRTLRATFAWSHDLLDPDEQTVFRRLGVAVGGCGRDAAEAICGDEDGQLDAHLRSLAEKHMILWTDTDDGPRIGMLETIREFAIERLRESGENATIERRHAHHYLSVTTRAEQHLVDAEQVAWFERLETEQGNLRASLTWALDQETDDVTTGLRGAVALWRFWMRRRTLREGIDWLERALARNGMEPQLRAQGLVALARLHEARSTYDRAEKLIDEAMPIVRDLGDQASEGDALTVLGEIAEDQADFAQASAHYLQALELYQANGLRRESATALNKLATIAYYKVDFDRATILWEESVAIYRELEDRWATGVLLGNLGLAAMATGNFDRAVALHEENLSIARLLGDNGTIGRELLNLAEALQARGDGDQDTLLSEALHLQRETSDRHSEIATLALMADNALARDEIRCAADLLAKSLSQCQSTGDRAALANAALLERSAALALASNQDAFSASLLGAAESLRNELEAPIMPHLRSIRDRCLEHLEARMRAEARVTAMAEGRELPADVAMATALAICERVQPPAQDTCAPKRDPLAAATPRSIP
jgi:predicted ATPase/DNA-binding SARP family transcriptional activator